MIIQRPTHEELQATINDWNHRHPVGTQVYSQIYPGKPHRTKTPAMTLFNQKPVIYLEGFNGYFDLGEVAPVTEHANIVEVDKREVAETASNAVKLSAPTSVAAPATEQLRTVVMFPGQGIQRKGMGEALFKAYPELTDLASQTLGYRIDELCLNDPDGRLGQTRYTQPALYVVNALGYLHNTENNPGNLPDAFMGHSVGEYNALLAAGVFDFETGLKLVARRGELMSEASGGAMAAVMGVPPNRIVELIEEAGIDGVDLANFNSPKQTVISGPDQAVAQAVAALGKEDIMVIPLAVSAAFHSRYMLPAQERFAAFLAEFRFGPPSRPVIANKTARPYQDDAIASTLAEQIASPVRWSDSVRFALDAGATEFREIDSTILTNMVRDIRAAIS
jgi:trans-AT polyketide synthase/acyltransferase/oxidoreductase domain-containing protein